ncbi:MAG: hypothetical protein U0931_33800 [Vulcanimicrobiota bacterium]
MIIQSRIQQMRQTAASSAWTDDEADDDPWSGYGDTLEMELNSTSQAAPATAVTPPTATASSGAEQVYVETVDASAGFEQVDEFAAAGARLHQRSQDLHQQHVLRSARRQVSNYFPHLEQGYGYGLSGRGYAPTHYYTPAPAPVHYTPQPGHHATPAVPQVINMEPDPLVGQPQALPYEIDAYGNPILPDGMELDAWGNLVPRNEYYNN